MSKQPQFSVAVGTQFVGTCSSHCLDETDRPPAWTKWEQLTLRIAMSFWNTIVAKLIIELGWTVLEAKIRDRQFTNPSQGSCGRSHLIQARGVSVICWMTGPMSLCQRQKSSPSENDLEIAQTTMEAFSHCLENYLLRLMVFDGFELFKTIWQSMLSFYKFGFPKNLKSDEGSEFNNWLLRGILEATEVIQSISSAYHTMSQDSVEILTRVFQVLITLWVKNLWKYLMELENLSFKKSQARGRDSLGLGPQKSWVCL